MFDFHPFLDPPPVTPTCCAAPHSSHRTLTFIYIDFQLRCIRLVLVHTRRLQSREIICLVGSLSPSTLPLQAALHYTNKIFT